MKRRWIVASIAVAVLALGVFTAGIVFAQTTDDEDTSTVSKLASKVASILGLDEDTVEDAIAQARQELMDEAIQAKLDAMVEAGYLTRQQADEYKAWLDSRPEGIERFGKGWFGGRRHHRGHHGLRGFDRD